MGTYIILVGMAIVLFGTFWKSNEEKHSANEMKNLAEENIELGNQNKSLTEVLTKTSLVNYEKSQRPQINVLSVGVGIDDITKMPSYKLVVRNTGASTAFNVEMHIDSHTEPEVSQNTIINMKEIPANVHSSYSIPMFRTQSLSGNLQDYRNEIKELNRTFQLEKKYIQVYFHFKYTWDEKNYETDSYMLFQSNGEKPHISKGIKPPQ